MKPDTFYALLAIGVFIVVVAVGQFSPAILQLLLTLTRPGATVLLLGGVAYLYHRGLHATALIVGILVVYLLKDLWTNWIRSDARRLYLEVGRDLDRFNPAKSIDLQFANGTAGFDAPSMLVSPVHSDMLVFPPSAETLAAMNGV